MNDYRTGPDGTSGNLPPASPWHGVRLSRLTHPRATAFSMLLLATVFLLFGLVVSVFAGA